MHTSLNLVSPKLLAFGLTLGAGAFLGLSPSDVHSEAAPATPPAGIVASIAKAPILADGDVAGEETDLVITLNSDLDPAVPGRTLLAGNTIKITLPSDFVNLGLPVGNPGPPPACSATAGNCSTGVLLQGWPQNPIPPAPTNYTLSLEGTHTIVYTATRDLVPGDPTLNGPGIKQMHVILNGFRNPKPGTYTVQVAAETGPGGALEVGSAPVLIRPNARASINVTSIFAGPPPFANTIYQQAAPGGMIPIPWSFLLWDSHGNSALGVTIQQVNENRALIMNGNRVVGRVSIAAPRRATGQLVTSQAPSTMTTGPVLNNPAGLLTVDFRAGNLPGPYLVTLQMNNGTSVAMHVQVN